jgi:hypothetical protein
MSLRRSGKFAPAGGVVYCIISNVGPSPVDVTATIYDLVGAGIAPDLETCDGTYNGALAAGRSCYSAKSGPVGGARCTFDASSSKVRAELLVLEAGGIPVSNLPATKK